MRITNISEPTSLTWIESFTPTVVIPLLTRQNTLFKTRTLLDSGTEANWIARDVLRQVQHVKLGKVKVTVYHFGGTQEKEYDYVQIYLPKFTKTSTQDEDTTQLISIECMVTEEYFYHKIIEGVKEFFQNLDEISSEEYEQISDPADEDVDHARTSLSTGLILSDATKSLIWQENKNQKVLKKHRMFLQPTIYGWAVSGKIPEHLLSNIKEIGTACSIPRVAKGLKAHRTSCRLTGSRVTISPDYQQDDLEDMVKVMWDQEVAFGVSQNETSPEDDMARNIVLQDIRFDEENKQFVTPLPFNGKEEFLHPNHYQAGVRVRIQHTKMLRDEEYMKGGTAAFQKMVDYKAVEKVGPRANPPEGIVCYLPWRFVVNRENKTTTFRMVMDASARPSGRDLSLNQCLLQGPNTVINLAACIIRFMLGKCRTVADFEKAFLMIQILEKHRDALRFYWFKDPADLNSDLIVYRFRVVLFGSISSPFLLAVVLEKIIMDDISDKAVQETLLKNIYVDNVCVASDSAEFLERVYDSVEVFKSRGFRLRKWNTNCPQLLERAKADNLHDDTSVISVLGLMWDVTSDSFGFKGVVWDGKNTKRSALRTNNGVFDPLGRFLPITMQGRRFISKLWETGYKWDRDFSSSEEMSSEYQNVRTQIDLIVQHRFPVQLRISPNAQLHAFADASTTAYGAIAFVVIPRGEEFPCGYVKQVLARGKLTPPKSRHTVNDTVPRWELLSIVTASQIVKFLHDNVPLLRALRVIIWNDSRPALGWCSSKDIKTAYVLRRVKTIRDNVLTVHTSQMAEIRHVPTGDNPADVSTRAITAKELMECEKWWAGPHWIVDENQWPVVEQEYSLDPPLISTINISPTNPVGKKELELGRESWLNTIFKGKKLFQGLRLLANLVRFINRCKKIRLSKIIELEEAKLVAIKAMQRECFPVEIMTLYEGKKVKSGRCRLFQLQLDPEGIVRCMARVTFNLPDAGEVAPILVDATNPYLQAWLKDQHLVLNCMGKAAMKNMVRAKVHGPFLAREVSKIVKSCLKCAKARATPYHYPAQPALPKARLMAEKPFKNVGVDYCGPFTVRGEECKEKVWVCIFTCMVTRGVYLVMVENCEARTFLDALYQLSYRRNCPTFLLSDNATYFVGTKTYLEKMAENRDVKGSLEDLGITWKFTSPYSPWQGGIYERLVGVFKKELLKLCQGFTFTKYDFQQCLYQIEGIMNSRPLQLDHEEEAITPAHFTGGEIPFARIFSFMDKEKQYEEMLRAQNKLAHIYAESREKLKMFWVALWDQYLSNLRFTKDSTGNRFRKIPKIGDVCIIWNDTDPRSRWKKGLITDLIKSDDGMIRKARVRIQSSTKKHEIITRSVNHLYHVEVNDKGFVDMYNKLREEANQDQQHDEKIDKRKKEAIRERSQRGAAIAAKEKIRDIALSE